MQDFWANAGAAPAPGCNFLGDAPKKRRRTPPCGLASLSRRNPMCRPGRLWSCNNARALRWPNRIGHSAPRPREATHSFCWPAHSADSLLSRNYDGLGDPNRVGAGRLLGPPPARTGVLHFYSPLAPGARGASSPTSPVRPSFGHRFRLSVRVRHSPRARTRRRHGLNTLELSGGWRDPQGHVHKGKIRSRLPAHRPAPS